MYMFVTKKSKNLAPGIIFFVNIIKCLVEYDAHISAKSESV